MADSTIMADVVDGKVQTGFTPTNASKENNKGTDALGKDAFLSLLVTQLQYQDPLNPASDTEFIGQLAQFSALEEMQNVSEGIGKLSGVLSNTQAESLVGKNVIMYTDGEYKAGYVQYMEIQDGIPYLSIDDVLYSIEDLDSVVSDAYLYAVLNASKDSNDTSEAASDSQNKETTEV